MSLNKLDNVSVTLLLVFAMMLAFGCGIVLARHAVEEAAEPVDNTTAVMTHTTEIPNTQTPSDEYYVPTLDELIPAGRFFWFYGPILEFMYKNFVSP